MAKYGWYSQKMRDRINSNNQYRSRGDQSTPACVYRFKDGTEKVVTTISESNNLQDLRKDGLFVDYDDLICLGEIHESRGFVRGLRQ